MSVGFDITATESDDGVELAGLLDLVRVFLFFLAPSAGTSGGSGRGNSGGSCGCYGCGRRGSGYGLLVGMGKSRNGQDLESQDEAGLELHLERLRCCLFCFVGGYE